MESKVYNKHRGRHQRGLNHHNSYMEHEMEDAFANMNNKMAHNFEDLEKKMEETMKSSLDKMNEKIDKLGKGDEEGTKTARSSTVTSGTTRTVIGPDGKK